MRKLSLLLLACLTLGIAWAERVSVNTAQQVAANVAAGLSPSNLRSISDLKLVYAAPAKQQSGLRSVDNESDYYIFNVGTGDGFIIVAGEDRVRPVLGYSAEGEVDMEKMPGNMKAWLAGYQEEISWVAEQNISASDAIQKEWQEWLSGGKSMGTPVVSLKTAQWDQGDPYNRKTPTINGQHALTGCVATAMAIIMEYHKAQPVVSSTKNTYYFYQEDYDAMMADPQYDEITYHPYDWTLISNTDYNNGNFPDDDEAANAIAELMLHCGLNVQMQYGLGASNAYFVNATKALREVYGFKAARRIEKAYFTWSEWLKLLKNELNNKRPVYYDGQDQNNLGGHAFICDGYTSDDYFHINWGWGYRNPAYYNDYYLLTCLKSEGTDYDFSRDCGMMVDMYLTDEAEIKADLMFHIATCDFPLPVNENFVVECKMSNLGNTSFCGNITIGVIAADGTIKERMYEYNISPQDPLLEGYGWNSLLFTCKLSEPLADGEMLVPIYKTTDGDWQVMEGDVKGIGMDGIIEKEEEEEPLPTVTVQSLSNPFSFRYMAVNNAYLGFTYRDWEVDPVQYKLTGAEGDVWVYYTLKNPAWADKIDLCYDLESPVYSYSESKELRFDSKGNAWVKIPADKITDGLVTNYLYWEINEKVAEDLDYSISLWNSDKSVCYQTFDYKMSVVEQPMDLAFSPENLSGGIGDEFLFSIIAKNVDPKMAGQQTSIALSIEGSVADEIAIDLITESERKALNVMPCGDDNACVTEAEIVQNLAEGNEYRFALRFKNGRQPGGIIRVSDMFINGNMSAVYTLKELSIDNNTTIIVDAEMPYENAHNGKDIIVKSTGIYTVNTADASINSLTVKDGGQVVIQQPLTVNEKARVVLDIPTDKWRTVAMPFDALVLADGTDMCFKYGYRFKNEQRWVEEEYWTNGQYALTTSPYIAAAEFDMTHVVFEQMGEYSLVLLKPAYTADGNEENGNWFHFVANPNWQNLLVNGKAYVLNDAGNSFELQQSPVIPPFQAYMIASEAVMKQVSSLRIGGIPTSTEDLSVTGFRVWTESGHVCFETTEAKNVAVYSMNGVLQCRFERSVGVHRQQLPQGIYIVVCDGTAYKVSVK